MGFISGVSTKELNDPRLKRSAKRKIIINGISFIIGLTFVFVVFGMIAGVFGQMFELFRVWFTRISGILIIFFGLFLLGVLNLRFLQAKKWIHVPSFLKIGNPTSSLVVGSAFAFGWTPCVGPILGSILFLASNSATALQGAFLLSVFSFGLATPFLLITFGIGSAESYIRAYFGFIQKYKTWILAIFGFIAGLLFNLVISVFSHMIDSQGRLLFILETLPVATFVIPMLFALVLGFYGFKREVQDPVSFVAGLFLVVLGLLFVTDSFALITQYGYRFFDFINYEALIDYPQ